MAIGDTRAIVLEGVRYTAHARGPTPWSKPPRRWWQLWRRRDPYDPMASEWIEFTGHPTPLRSRATTAIQQDSLHTLPEDQLRYLLERALESAHFPHGHDMVALTRGDQRIVMSWGEWNWLMAVLLGCKYEMESSTRGPYVSEGDAHALHRMIEELHKHGQKGEALLPYDLPSGFVEFLEGGAFRLIDIG